MMNNSLPQKGLEAKIAKRNTNKMRGDNLTKKKQEKANKQLKKMKNCETQTIKQESSQSSRSTSPQPNQFPENTTKILSEIKKNMKLPKNRRTWSILIISICTFILFTSHTSYRFLRSNLLLPSRSTLYRYLQTFESYDAKLLTNLKNLNSITANYRKTNDISNEDEIRGILAIDAVSLKPHIKITDDGEILGLTQKVVLNKSEIKKLNSIVKDEENLIKELKSLTVTDAFVYYFQPLNPLQKCFPVYIQGASSGKAGPEQIKLLKIIKESISKYNFKVISFSSDGDSAFSSLAKDNINNWKNNERPILKNDFTYYTNDPLHLIKRGRYRFLSHDLVLMNDDDEQINISNVQELSNLPSIVFDNSKITKMHDTLPLKLFDLSVFQILEYSELYTECAYFFPFTMIIESLTSETLSINERVDLLEITIYFCKFYKMIIEKVKNHSKQKGKGKCVLFDLRLINDIESTALTINSIINNEAGLISLNRIGTNPLEHHFGLLRIRSKYHHTFERFLNEEKKVSILHEIEMMTIGNAVLRNAQFGEIIFSDDEKHGEKSLFSNRDFALAILWKYNFPTKLIQRNCECKYEILYDIFINKINNIENRKNSNKNKKFKLNSNDYTLGVSSKSNIRKRQENGVWTSL